MLNDANRYKRRKKYIEAWQILGLTAGIGVLLLGCTPSSSDEASSQTNDPAAVSPPPSPLTQISGRQELPISAYVEIANQKINLEVAQTSEQQATGLMFRDSLPDNRGMLFPFDPPRSVQFWMRNVEIHLDMVFLQDGEVVAIATNVPPCTASPCPTYGPDTPVDQVIELRGGLAQNLGLQVGDSLIVQFVDADS
ncbi:MAG: DUF192 domain-containing protein [Elainellaceae cyanobacterium]